MKNFERNTKFREYLQDQLVLKTKRNPKYSVRAFARQLGLEPSALAQIINSRRSLTDKMCLRLAKKLTLNPDLVNDLMGHSNGTTKDQLKPFNSVDVDIFKTISDWYHYAILELTYVDHFKSDERWVSKTLGISIIEVKDAVQRLRRLGFLEIDSNGKWIDRLGYANNLGNEFTAPAFRKLQSQILQKAIDALETIDYSERVQTSMTLVADKSKLPEAKRKILTFINELNDFLRTGPKKDDVFHMSISLYPVSNSVKGDSK